MIRPVKFIIQPILVEDDGTHLREVIAEPITVPASDLAGFPAYFAEQLARQQPEEGTA